MKAFLCQFGAAGQELVQPLSMRWTSKSEWRRPSPEAGGALAGYLNRKLADAV
jgi:hypothetical protein